MTDDILEEGVCSICGLPYTSWGHNPEPIRPYDNRCCTECNFKFVIPARLGHVTTIKCVDGFVWQG